MIEDCFVCAATATDSRNLPWYDQAIHRTPGVGITLLGVGAIAPGYLLACPEIHVASLALLPLSVRVSFAAFVDRAVHELACAFGQPLLFEHGACEHEARSSSCVSHAHLHLWSVADTVRLNVPTVTRTYRDVQEFILTHSADDASYLMCSMADNRIAFGPDVGAPQFFRRQVAAQLGSPDRWDYALFAFESNMRATRDALFRGPRGWDHDN